MVKKFFRKKRNFRIIMWITAILIIPGFLIWGVGIGGGSKTKYLAAIVNGQPISLREYYMALDRVEERYREIFGDKFDEIIKKENLQYDERPEDYPLALPVLAGVCNGVPRF